MKHELCGRHWIDGRWAAAATDGAETFEAVNPATGEALTPSFAEAMFDEVDAALSAAQKAFLVVTGGSPVGKTAGEPPAATVSERDPRWPAELLEVIASQIEALGDDLLERAELETALPRRRLIGERTRTCSQLRMFADIVREGSWVEAVIDLAPPLTPPRAGEGKGEGQPLPKPDLRRMLRPRGPVVVFGASNFPFAFGVCGGDTASALAGGNPVIVKGHPSHPGTSELFASAVAAAVDECQLPAGLFALVQGKQHELSAWLVQHDHTRTVGFTGSHRAGRALFDLASRRQTPIPVYAEMGSVNPVVILPTAISERGETIAQELSASLLVGGGQFCTKPGVVFVVGDHERTFIDALAREMQSAPQATMLNRGLRDAFAERAASISGASGVTTEVLGEASGHAHITPWLFATSADTFRRERQLHAELFGPGGVIVTCDSAEEALACVELLGGNLTGTVHVGSDEDQSLAAGVIRSLENAAGRVIVNGYPTGVEVGRAVVHGGPYPATTDSGTTSVGSAAIRRFVRPLAYQNTPQQLLPPALQNHNPLAIMRLVNGEWTDRSW